MGVAVILGLIVTVIALSLELTRVYKVNRKYEQELITKARKGKKNGSAR